MIKRAALKSGKVQTFSSQLTVIAEYVLSEIRYADILVVPGAENATALREYPKILAWIREIYHNTLYTTSVCTGSLILGAAGILQNVSATSHWAVLDRLNQYGAKSVQSRVVTSGKIITAAGVSAGIDMALMLAAKLAGQSTAEAVQLGIEYDPKPRFNKGSPHKASAAVREALYEKLNQSFLK